MIKEIAILKSSEWLFRFLHLKLFKPPVSPVQLAVCTDSDGGEDSENGDNEYKVDGPSADIQPAIGERCLRFFDENAQYGQIEDVKVLLDAVQAHECAGNKDAVNRIETEVKEEESLDILVLELPKRCFYLNVIFE